MERTNTVRKTKPGDEYYVDLNHYGAARAFEAHVDQIGEEEGKIEFGSQLEEDKEIPLNM